MRIKSTEQTESGKLRRTEKIFGERWNIRMIISRQSVSAFQKVTSKFYDQHKKLMLQFLIYSSLSEEVLTCHSIVVSSSFQFTLKINAEIILMLNYPIETSIIRHTVCCHTQVLISHSTSFIARFTIVIQSLPRPRVYGRFRPFFRFARLVGSRS
jgi:hypothetical protein